MDVNAASTTLLFKCLTDEEQTQLQAEGCSFRCWAQWHMAGSCPKNTNCMDKLNMQESTATTTSEPNNTTNSLNTTTTKLPGPKLMYAQQICILKEKMTKEEWGVYLDMHNMGEDFCSAEL